MSPRLRRRDALFLTLLAGWAWPQLAGAEPPAGVGPQAGVPVSAAPLSPGQMTEGEILVRYRPGVSRAAADALNRSHGVRVLEVIPELGVHRLAVPSGRVPEKVEAYRRDPRCEYAEPNLLGQGGFVPNDTHFPAQWHLHNTAQVPGGVADADVDAVEGWDITRGDASIVAAVLDTGIDSNHAEFAGRILPGYDFVKDDTNPEDDHGHGSYVTGILAANADNSFSVAGVDHAVQILPVKILNQNNVGTTFDLAQGLTFAADEGADVINMSLIDYPPSSTLTDALQYARNAGSVLVACAGNGGLGDADVSQPGASPLTISVGATNPDDSRASFSATGAALDLVAPGSIVRTIVFDSSSNGFTSFTGCSAATPIVAGVATLLLSLDPLLTHDDVHDVLAQTAEDQVGPPAEDTPGRDDFFGDGRVNLHQAVLAAAPECANTLDDDGDGLVDDGADPGCDGPQDPSERSTSPLLPCDDGQDNDFDGRSDFDPVTYADPAHTAGTGDPGCNSPSAPRENPQCQDGQNNDGQLGTDFDGGASVPGAGIDPNGADPQCVAKPWRNREAIVTGCGLGFELAVLVPLLGAGARGRRVRLRAAKRSRASSAC